MGMKDPTTDLWTLPIIGSAGKTSQMDTHDEQNVFDNLHDEFLERANAAHSTTPSSPAVPSCASTQACATGKAAKNKLPNPHPIDFGLFTHIVQTKANSIKFVHQLLCSPTISTILKAIRGGFLNGCPNLLAKEVSRYLNPSPATAKVRKYARAEGVTLPPSEDLCPSGESHSPAAEAQNLTQFGEKGKNVSET